MLGTYEATLLTKQCDCTCDIYLKKKLKKVNKSDYEWVSSLNEAMVGPKYYIQS